MTKRIFKNGIILLCAECGKAYKHGSWIDISLETIELMIKHGCTFCITACFECKRKLGLLESVSLPYHKIEASKAEEVKTALGKNGDAHADYYSLGHA